MGSLDLGNVPGWLSTISVVIAALTYWRSARDKVREQASKISSWLSIDENTGTRQVRITNYSDSPIYSVGVKAVIGGPFCLDELPAGSTVMIDLSPADSGKPHTRQMVNVLEVPGGLLRAEVTTTIFTHEPLPELSFRDARGRWWQRNPLGRVTRSRRPKEQIRRATAIKFFDGHVATIARATDDGGRRRILVTKGADYPFDWPAFTKDPPDGAKK